MSTSSRLEERIKRKATIVAAAFVGLALLGAALPGKHSSSAAHSGARGHPLTDATNPKGSSAPARIQAVEANRHALERQRDPNMALCISAGLTPHQCEANREYAEAHTGVSALLTPRLRREAKAKEIPVEVLVHREALRLREEGR